MNSLLARSACTAVFVILVILTDWRSERPPVRKWFEAESAPRDSVEFIPISDSLASNGEALQAVGEHHVVTGKIGFHLGEIKKGKYQVWLRVMWPGACANSIILQQGNGLKLIIGNDYNFKKWHWVKGPEIYSNGTDESINVFNYEYKAGIDGILITNEFGWTPGDDFKEFRRSYALNGTDCRGAALIPDWIGRRFPRKLSVATPSLENFLITLKISERAHSAQALPIVMSLNGNSKILFHDSHSPINDGKHEYAALVPIDLNRTPKEISIFGDHEGRMNVELDYSSVHSSRVTGFQSLSNIEVEAGGGKGNYGLLEVSSLSEAPHGTFWTGDSAVLRQSFSQKGDGMYVLNQDSFFIPKFICEAIIRPRGGSKVGMILGFENAGNYTSLLCDGKTISIWEAENGVLDKIQTFEAGFDEANFYRLSVAVRNDSMLVHCDGRRILKPYYLPKAHKRIGIHFDGVKDFPISQFIRKFSISPLRQGIKVGRISTLYDFSIPTLVDEWRADWNMLGIPLAFDEMGLHLRDGGSRLFEKKSPIDFDKLEIILGELKDGGHLDLKFFDSNRMLTTECRVESARIIFSNAGSQAAVSDLEGPIRSLEIRKIEKVLRISINGIDVFPDKILSVPGQFIQLSGDKAIIRRIKVDEINGRANL